MVQKIKNKNFGKCHICGESRPLTYEHIPPKSAFNDFPQYELDFWDDGNTYEQFFATGKPKGRPLQKGVGKYCLCAECNNNTGAFYGNSFTSFIRQIHEQFIEQEITFEKGKLQEHKYKLFPLRVIKQIVSMFLSMNEYSLYSNSNKRDRIKNFILDKESNDFPEDLRIYFYVLSPKTSFIRKCKYGVMADVIEGLSEIQGTEISFWTSGFILTDQEFLTSPDEDLRGLVDITFFKSYTYNSEEEFEMELPIYPNNTHLLGDFRTRDEILVEGVMPAGNILLANKGSMKANYPHRK